MDGETIVQSDVINIYERESRTGVSVIMAVLITSLLWASAMAVTIGVYHQRRVELHDIVSEECKKVFEQNLTFVQ